jgi:hypothetical protein
MHRLELEFPAALTQCLSFVLGLAQINVQISGYFVKTICHASDASPDHPAVVDVRKIDTDVLFWANL